MTATLKDMLLASLDKAGGIEYLVRQSAENPQAYMSLIGKVLPLQIGGDANNPLKVIVETGVPRD